jgi:hypothetical protein
MANRPSDDTFRGARNLSLGRITRGSLGKGDRADFYKFSASSPVDFSLTVGGLRSNVNVRLLDGNRAPIASSQQPKNRPEQISATLDGGTFFVEVRLAGRGNTRYTLKTSVVPTPVPDPLVPEDLVPDPLEPDPPLPPDPNGTIATAFDIGVLTTTYIKQDTIGISDLIDFYKFTLNDIANLEARVDGSARVRSIELIRDQNSNGLVDNGEVFASRLFSGLTPLDIPSGTYFIKVEGFSNVSSPYELTLVPTLFGGNVSPEPGNTLPLASNTLGVFSGTRSIKEYIGTLDANDFYKFELNDLSNLQINVTGASTAGGIELLRDNNNNGLIDDDEVFLRRFTGGSIGVSVNEDLPKGEYFINVEPLNRVGSTSYEMILVGTPYGGDGSDDPGNTLLAARDLGILFGTSSLKEYVGVLDSDDFYKFTLSNAANLQARITGSSVPTITNASLIQDINDNGLIDSNERLFTIGQLPRDLQAGTYFFRVAPNGNSSTNYQLDLTVT